MKEPWPTTDVHKAQKLRQSDQSAWSWLARTYTEIIYRTLRGAGLKHQEAEDVTQEVLVKMRASNFAGQGRFRWFLLTTIRNACRDHVKKRRRQPPGVGGSSILERLGKASGRAAREPSEQLQQQYETQLRRVAMKQVQRETSALHWQAFWQTFVEGQKSAIVAQRLNLKEGYVRQIKRRILDRITERIAALELTMKVEFQSDSNSDFSIQPPKSSNR
jgi:RNA polymerase sigma factor (sigma-70 family)